MMRLLQPSQTNKDDGSDEYAPFVMLDSDPCDSQQEKSCRGNKGAHWSRFVRVSLVLLGFAWLLLGPKQSRDCFRNSASSTSINEETLPTLLNVLLATKDSAKDAPSYLNSLSNPLYQRLEHALWHLSTGNDDDDDNSRIPVLEPPRLMISHTNISFYEPLLVSWTLGSKLADETAFIEGPSRLPLVTNETLLILSCHDGNENGDHVNGASLFERILYSVKEAVTVQQALETSRHHVQQTDPSVLAQFDVDNSQSWFIPRFPAIRHKYCQFRLYESTEIYLDPDDTASVTERLVPIAESPLMTIQSFKTPLSIHLALASDPSQMVVNFVTGQGSECLSTIPMVVYGTNSSQQLVRTGTTTTYTADDLCQAPANQLKPGKFSDPGCLHSVTMDELEPDTLYWYQVWVQDDDNDSAVEPSARYEFWSPPAVTNSDYTSEVQVHDNDVQPFAFLAYGDQGCPETGWTTGAELVARMVETELDDATKPMVRMVHHIGDLSYAEGAGHIWDEWQRMIAPVATRVPYMVGIGNHEYDHRDGGAGKDPSGVPTDGGFLPSWGNMGNDSGGECGVPTAKRFTMPSSNTSNGVFWHSFDFANLHTIIISSEHDLQRGSPQHDWLEDDLRSVDRSKTPWVVVETHRPLYIPDTRWHRDTVSWGMRLEIEDLLKDFNVDLVLAGHFHSYHRSCAGLYREKCDNGGPTHVMIGSGGARLELARHRHASWTAQSLHEYGYGRFTIMNATALHFEYVHVDKLNTSPGVVHDEFWMHRDL